MEEYKIIREDGAYPITYLRENITDGDVDFIKHTIIYRKNIFTSLKSLDDVVRKFDEFISGREKRK